MEFDPLTQLKTLPEEAVDILRYFHTSGESSAHAETIMAGAGLSERGFGKGIRRLVTKSYVALDGDQVYRLTEAGRRLVDVVESVSASEIADDSPDDQAEEAAAAPRAERRFVRRRLIVALPQPLIAQQPTHLHVGFAEAENSERAAGSIPILVRINLLNGEPSQPIETALLVENRTVHQVYEITAGDASAARVRVQVAQADEDETEQRSRGGLYIDVPVEKVTVSQTMTAYGADVLLEEPAANLDPFAEI